MMASTVDVELRSHGYQVLRRPWEITGRYDEIDKKLRNNESNDVGTLRQDIEFSVSQTTLVKKLIVIVRIVRI